MKRNLRILIAVTIALKVVLLFTVNKRIQLNNDEERNYQVALNKLQGKNYSFFDPYKKSYQLTAFHGTWSVLIYEQLIKWDISKNAWYFFIHFAGIIIFAFSIPAFYKLSYRLNGHEIFSFLATITYSIYPSLLVYIGTGFFYENIVLPILVIVIYRCTNAIRNGFNSLDYFLLPVFVIVSTMLRTHTILIYLLLILVISVISVNRKKSVNLKLLALIITGGALVQVPVLLKNKKLFGSPVLSTQSGFELMQGHNPMARGSWRSDWFIPGTPFYNYAQHEIKGIEKLNEYEEGKARGHHAIQWIKENPLSEIKLTIRKLAIYFVPTNYGMVPGSNLWNPVNFLVHAGFFLWLVYAVVKHSPSADEWIVLTPVLSSILLSVIFFVGHRWRLYAEPFMILLAWKVISDIFHRYRLRSIT